MPVSTGVSFQILSHAGLRVKSGGKELLCDPWLTGSAYWRSWWNYPPVPRSLVDSLKPDFIYLTHLHWDHFHGPSLRLFDPQVPVIIPYDRYGRTARDLRAIGRKEIIEVRHGERLQLGDGLAIRSYHFSPFITDSALAIEAGDVVLLNFNDAKFAGLPLRQIQKHYPAIDFCFRSHSSANPRACFHEIGNEQEFLDDNERYLEAFSLFMARVKPRYAIPFASNSCLLHDDTIGMDSLVQTPLAVEQHFRQFGQGRAIDTEIRVMVPGDSWDSEKGFSIASHDYFTERGKHIADYRNRVRPTLDRQASIEGRATVSLAMVSKFFARLADATPRLLKRKLRDRNILIVSRSAAGTSGFSVDLWNGRVDAVEPERFDDYAARIEIPAFIFRQSLLSNMFEHAGISKRVHYYATREAMPALKRFTAILAWYEAELIPLKGHFTPRTVRALAPRWREAFLYGRTIYEIARGKTLPDIERLLLA